MIIEGLLTIVKNLLELLLTPIDIPELPESVSTIIQQACTYFAIGIFWSTHLTNL